MSGAIMLALLCAGIAILYGVITSRWILAQPAGSERMQAISAAVQEGAQAYLKRQWHRFLDHQQGKIGFQGLVNVF